MFICIQLEDADQPIPLRRETEATRSRRLRTNKNERPP